MSHNTLYTQSMKWLSSRVAVAISLDTCCAIHHCLTNSIARLVCLNSVDKEARRSQNEHAK